MQTYVTNPLLSSVLIDSNNKYLLSVGTEHSEISATIFKDSLKIQIENNLS